MGKKSRVRVINISIYCFYVNAFVRLEVLKKKIFYVNALV